jgi:hypothetical protein
MVSIKLQKQFILEKGTNGLYVCLEDTFMHFVSKFVWPSNWTLRDWALIDEICSLESVNVLRHQMSNPKP